jgi:hypothetical protein
MILERVLFSVDSPSDIHEYNAAIRQLSQMEVMGKLSELVPCIGSFDGFLEPSFMVLAGDFEKHIRNAFFLEGQQTILRVPGDQRQPCVLEWLETGGRISVGPMRCVSRKQALSVDSWTYRLDTNQYFTTEKVA